MRGPLPVVLAVLAVTGALPAPATAAKPRWLASATSTMTASVERPQPCGPSRATYEIRTRTKQPIPVRGRSPAPGVPGRVRAFFRAPTRVTTTLMEDVVDCVGGEGEACGGSGAVRTDRPRYSARTIRAARLKVDVGSATPAPFFVPKRGCTDFIVDRRGLLPRRFEARVTRRVLYGRFFRRDRFRIRIAARGYPVSVVDRNGNRLRGRGSFSMVVRFRPG